MFICKMLLNKSYFIKRLFYALAPFLLFKRLLRAEYKRYKILYSGLPYFSYDEIKEISRLKSCNSIAVIGSGTSVEDLNDQDVKSMKNYLSFGISRIIELDFATDILYAEFSLKLSDWKEEFLKRINKKAGQFENTIILLEVNDASMNLHHEIYDKIDKKLKKNIRFISHVSSISDSRIIKYIINNKYLLRYMFQRDLLWHCRTSSFYGVSLALALDIDRIHLIGLDGYSGYFNVKSPLNLPSDIQNLNNELHSTYDPLYGRPTILDAINSASNQIKFTVQSKKMIFSKYFPVKRLSDTSI